MTSDVDQLCLIAIRYTYVLASDGDLMDGVASVQHIDGQDVAAVDAALTEARSVGPRIAASTCRTTSSARGTSIRRPTPRWRDAATSRARWRRRPVLDRTTLAPASGLAQGAYILAEAGAGPPEIILIATGSEVPLALEAHARLAGDGIRSRVVSMPCWELFDAQPQSYRDTVLPPGVGARVAIEAAAPFGWERYVGSEGVVIGVTGFGASAPGPIVMREFGFTPEHVVETAKALLNGRASRLSHAPVGR